MKKQKFIAILVAVLTIILTISIIALVKYSKGKKKTHYKSSKKMKKGQAAVDGLNNNAEIKVYKDYTGVQGGSSGGTGGGPVNSRPPENNNKDGMGK